MSRLLHIVIIDDAMRLCSDLRDWLAAAGHRVQCTPAQPLILHRLAETCPDLIILGIVRFSGQGMDLYRRLRSNRSLGPLPVIVLSEDSSLEHELLDVFDFQVRPFDRDRLLACLARLNRKEGQPSQWPTSPDVLDKFKSLLRERSALHFSQRNQRILERGLQRRMMALQLPSADDYYQFLQDNQGNYDELNKLLQFLTVGETCFFRYRSHRAALLHRVVPQLIEQNRHRRSLHIWSAGCSTGEEPYSLAILLQENFPQLGGWDLRIVATDINKRALRQAREGIYGPRSVRLVEPELLHRYFDQSGSLYKVKPQVRGMVRFDYLNLMTDRFPDPANQTEAIDLLMCRNVLIYFELDIIRHIVDQFANCLSENGLLFLGHAETMQNVSDRFSRVHDQGAFFYQLKKNQGTSPRRTPAQSSDPRPESVKPSPSIAMAAMPPPPPPATPTATEQSAQEHLPAVPPRFSAAELDQLYESAMQAFDHEQFVEAEQIFDQILGLQPRHALSLVGKGLLRANQGDYPEARLFCAKAISQNDLLAEAYLLRGLILDMEGHLERAMVEFQKVLWLDRNFIMGHYLLAKTHARLGQKEQSVRNLRNTIRCLEKSPDQSMIPFSGGLSRAVLINLARHDLERITTEPPADTAG